MAAHAISRAELDEMLRKGWTENGTVRARGKLHRNLVQRPGPRLATVIVSDAPRADVAR